MKKGALIAALPALQDTIELLDFAFITKDAFVSALADGKVTITDAVYFFGPLLAAKDAFDGAGQIPAEWANATTDERLEVVTFFQQKFDLKDDGLELLIEETLQEGVHLYELIVKWRAYRKPEAA